MNDTVAPMGDVAADGQVRFGVVPAHGPEHLDAAVEHLRLCRRYGFDSIWIEEHHTAGPYWPTPLLAAAALAAHLDGMWIGTDVLLLPFYDPLHVAEQAAVLDRLTDGRFILGVGLGDSSVESAAFRVPTTRRGARFEEQIAILRALWRGAPVTFEGAFYALKDVSLGQLPVQVGGPPVWIGGWGPRQLSRAATIGDAWFPGPVGTMTEIVHLHESYDRQLRQRHVDPSGRARPITRDVVIATTADEAWRIAKRTILKSYREAYVDAEHPLVGHASGVVFRSAVDLARDRLIIGDVRGVTAQIAKCISALRSNHVIFRLKLPGLAPDQMTRMLHLIGGEVLPELRRASATDSGLAVLAASERGS